MVFLFEVSVEGHLFVTDEGCSVASHFFLTDLESVLCTGIFFLILFAFQEVNSCLCGAVSVAWPIIKVPIMVEKT